MTGVTTTCCPVVVMAAAEVVTSPVVSAERGRQRDVPADDGTQQRQVSLGRDRQVTVPRIRRIHREGTPLLLRYTPLPVAPSPSRWRPRSPTGCWLCRSRRSPLSGPARLQTRESRPGPQWRRTEGHRTRRGDAVQTGSPRGAAARVAAAQIDLPVRAYIDVPGRRGGVRINVLAEPS